MIWISKVYCKKKFADSFEALAVGGQTVTRTMTEQELYDEAFRQMGEAPLEPNENTGPGRKPGNDGTGNRGRWKSHTRKVPLNSIRIDADVYEWLLIEAGNSDMSVRDYINSLLRQAYEAGRITE